ncbi:periostin-like isoform X1 [Salvelinus namaycush]|uniref:Periostin-like isoform X1 n=1 Tax=Salvelinus namaycush TaxID=8040 RepID=A0A8U1EQY6_SALNM|nr:periostin-like isoform X1 [Salvelinus namaycush]
MKLVFVAVLALFTLSSVDRVDSSAYDKIVTHSRIRARLQGPNVCAMQQVMGTRKRKYFSTCRNWYKGSICGKKAMVVYECCPGYMKLEGMKGCPAVAPIDHVYGTLGLVKARTTQKYSALSKLREEIEGKGSFTMFAPSDEAWDLLDPEVRGALVSNVNIELYNALHYHMVNHRMLTKDLKNDMSITSMYNNLGLYINHYSNGIVTVNCARIIHGNQVATNGVVHVIDRVITNVVNTIQDALGVDDDLSSFSAVALASGVMEKLGQPGHFTLFVPTDDAFRNLEDGFLERIMGDKAAITALVNYHLLNSVQCSEAILAGSVHETAEGSTVEIGCDGDSLTVNGIKMVLKKDIVTTNGVIHLIDRVLIPDSAKEVMELVGESQSTFRDMVSELGLSAAMKPETEYTLLAPLNPAFSDEVMSLDQSLLKVILENHILKQKHKLSELYNGQLLETIAGKQLRVFIYRTAVCIENACMVRGSKEGSNGALHLMRSLIKPAQTTIYQVLMAEGRFNIFLSLMKSAGLTELLKQEGSYTVFAPTDEAFDGLTERDITLLASDVNALRTILLYHFSNGVFINGGLEGGVTNLLKTIQGHNLQVLSVNKSIHVNSLDVPDIDLMATNGVVHVVKNILYPGDLPVGRESLLELLKKLIKYIQFKYVSGFSYPKIPLTFIKRTITTTTHVQAESHVDSVPEITKVTRVIKGEPTFTKVTRVIEGEPTITKVTRVIEGEPTITKVTRVIEGKPAITKVTRVIEGEPAITKVTRVIEGEPAITKVTRVIEGKPAITKVTRVIKGEPTITKVTRVVKGEPTITKVTRVVEGEPTLNKVKRVIEGEPAITKVTRVIEGLPSITKVTRVIETHRGSSDGRLETEGDINKMLEEGPEFSKITTIHGNPEMIDQESERITKLIQGPEFSKITTIHGNPEMIDQESERITKLIQGGGSMGAPAKRAPVGVRRRKVRLVRRHNNQKSHPAKTSPYQSRPAQSISVQP